MFYAIWKSGDRELLADKYSSRDAAICRAKELAAQGYGMFYVLASIGTAERVCAAEWVEHKE